MADTNEEITLICGEKSFSCSKAKLVEHCRYFEAIYSGQFADSEKKVHTFDTAMMDPTALESVVHYIETGEEVETEDLRVVVKLGQATAMLQIHPYDSVVWDLANELICPKRCIGYAKLLNYQSVGSLRSLKICFRWVLWKFYELIDTEDFFDLSPAEFYWILRNARVVDPSGGVMAFKAINSWIESRFKNEYDTEKSRDLKQNLCRELVFGFMEGLEEKIAMDAPMGDVRRAIMTQIPKEHSDQPRPSVETACATDQLAAAATEGESSVEAPATTSSSAVEGTSCDSPPLREKPSLELPPMKKRKIDESDPDETAPSKSPSAENIRTDVLYSNVLSVTEGNLETVRRWKEDENAFKYLFECQKKCSWKPCVVGYRSKPPAPGTTRKVPLQQAAIFCFDPDTCSMAQVTDLPVRMRGSRVTANGTQVFMLGGEKVIGCTHFLRDVHSYNWTTDCWDVLGVRTEPRRNFLLSWNGADCCVVLGGYELYRKQARDGDQLQLLWDSDLEALLDHDTMWTDDSKWITEFGSLGELPDHINPQLGAMACVEEHILLFCQSKQLHIYCFEAATWITKKPIFGIPDKCFKDAFPYGAGIYFTVWYSCDVYWLMLDFDLIGGILHSSSQTLPPASTAFKYGSFSFSPYNVCRIEDKLYSFTEDPQTNERVVEVLNLRYNPFDDPNEFTNGPNSTLNEETISPEVTDKPPVSPNAPSEGSSPGNNTNNPTKICIENIAPTLSSLEHCRALQNKEFSRYHRNVLETLADSERDSGLWAQDTAVKAARILTRSDVKDDLTDGSHSCKCKENSCIWCRKLLHPSNKQPANSDWDKVPTQVSARTLWKSSLTEDVQFKRTEDDVGICIGCFAIYDPL